MTVLCSEHARQAAREQTMPTGPCHPWPDWRGGGGETVECDMVAHPERVADYLYVIGRRGRKASQP